MEQIEAFINSRMTDMSFQPKNNNTLPKQIKQSNFYSTASTTPTDIMDVSKAYCWTYFFFKKKFFYKIDLKKKNYLFFNWTIIPSIVSTKLVWLFIFTLIVISQKIHTEKKIVYFHLYLPPLSKKHWKKTNPLQIMEIPCILSELSILLLLLYKCVYCTWRKENAVKIQNNFEFWNKKNKNNNILHLLNTHNKHSKPLLCCSEIQ